MNIAICTRASAMTLDFFGEENEYVRHAVRGQSTLFECLEQKDVVLQAVVPPSDFDNTTAAAVRRLLLLFSFLFFFLFVFFFFLFFLS